MRNEEGFTLIEVLISITILSFLMSYVYTIVDGSSRAKDTITKEDRELMDIERALDRIGIDFSQIDSPLYYSPVYRKPKNTPSFGQGPKPNLPDLSDSFPQLSHFGKPVPNKESSKTEFFFLSNANRRRLQDVKQGRGVWIKYSLESSDKSRGGYQLVRQFMAENVYNPEVDWDSVEEQPLLNNVKSLSFEFWDPGKKKFVSSIRELNNYKDMLRLIRLKIEWVGEGEGDSAIREITRSYRALWPKYDPFQDELIYKKAAEGNDKEGQPENDGGEF